MPAYGRDGLLSDAEIEDVTHYVRSLSGLEVDTEKAARGSATFMNQCATCHGTDAKGDRSQGALNLTDQEWLYGSDYRTVYASIYNARNSKMPGWEDRLDEATIKALAVYVHTLSGGE